MALIDGLTGDLSDTVFAQVSEKMSTRYVTV
jgi:hypothetical protein